MNETKNNEAFIGRVVFVSCLALTAIVLAFGSYVVLGNSERDLAEVQFESLADSFLQQAQVSTTRQRLGLIAMASVVSFDKPNTEEWPYVIVDGFEKISSEVVRTTLGRSVEFAPLVQPDQLSQYNDFAYEYLEANYPPGTGVSSVGRGVYGSLQSTGRSRQEHQYLEVDGVTLWGSPYNTLTPLIQFDTSPGSRGSNRNRMLNLHSDGDVGPVLDLIFACAEERQQLNDDSIECGTMAASNSENGVISHIIQPIYPASNPTALTGILRSTVRWQTLIEQIVAGNIHGLRVLSSQSSVFTFNIVDGTVDRVALIGDRHDSVYDKYARSASLTDALPISNSSETYTLTMYPNDEFFSSYSTSNPWIAAIGSACVMLLTSLLFFLYDFLMREEVEKRQGLLDSKRKFIRFVSHEVRTPLNTVCMGLSLLLEDLTATFPQAMLQRMRDESSSSSSGGDTAIPRITTRRPSSNIVASRSSTAHNSNDQLVALTSTLSTGNEESLGNTTVAAAGLVGGRAAAATAAATAAASASDWIQLTTEILDNAQSAVDVLNDVLNYDKIQMGKLTLDETIVPIWSLIERTVNEFSLQSLKAKVSVQLDFTTVYSEEGGTHTRYRDTTTAMVDTVAGASSGNNIGSSGSSNNSSSSSSSRRVLPESQTEQQQQQQQQQQWLALEPAAYERMVIGDSIRLTQVIRNLVSNALKFTPDNGKVSVTGEWLRDREEIQAEVEEGGNRASGNHNDLTHFTLNTGDECDFAKSGLLKLTVKDTGAGMSPDQVQKLFGEGVQFNANTLQAGGGSGLGLFIAKGIAEQHGGSLTVASEGLGLGTTFTLMLPLYHVPDSALPVGFEDVSQSNNNRPLQGSTTTMEGGGATSSSNSSNIQERVVSVAVVASSLHVLVVDDAESNRKMLTRSLKNKQHDCVQAKHGQEAIDKYVASLEPGARPFDAILMDFEMPVMNGPDATKVIRGLGCECVIVGVTGNVLTEDVNYFKSMGANEVLPKPLKIPELERVWCKHGLHATAENGANAGGGRESSTKTTNMHEVTNIEAFAPLSELETSKAGEEMV